MSLSDINLESPEVIMGLAATVLAVVEKFLKPISKLYTLLKPWIGRMKKKLPWIGMREMKQQMQNLAQSMASIADQVAKIAYQTEHNAGGSMRDDISYVRKEVELLSASTRTSMEMMEDGLFRCSHAGKIFLVNGPFANMLGVTREQLMDHEWLQWLRDTEFQDRMLRAMEMGTTFTGDTTVQDIDGKNLNVRIKIVKFMGTDFEGRVIQL